MRVYIIPAQAMHHGHDIDDGFILRSLQSIVDGFIEPCAPAELKEQGIELLANEEGLLRYLPANINMFPFFYVGNLVAVGVGLNDDGEEDFVSLTPEQENFLKRWLNNLP